jgi:hypothetical protein
MMNDIQLIMIRQAFMRHPKELPHARKEGLALIHQSARLHAIDDKIAMERGGPVRALGISAEGPGGATAYPGVIPPIAL